MEYCLDEQKEIAGHARRHCKACLAWYKRNYRRTENGKAAQKKHNDNLKKDGRAINAKKEIFILVRAGDLPKPSTLICVDCGKPAEVYDHRDYSKPLEVAPVCRSCNALRGPAI